MKYFYYALAIILATGLAEGAVRLFHIASVGPDLIFLAVAFLAARRPWPEWLFFAVFGGLMTDLITGLLPGSFIIGYGIVGFLVQTISRLLIGLRSDWRFLPAIVVLGLLILLPWLWLYNLFGQFLGQTSLLTWSFLIKTLSARLGYDLLLLYPVYAGTLFLEQLILKQEFKRRLGGS